MLSRSLVQKRHDYSRTRALDNAAWQNPYETLIGERLPETEYKFNKEDFKDR